jgi:hypothetical protein
MNAMTKPEKQGNGLEPAEQGYGTCGATHGDCPNTWYLRPRTRSRRLSSLQLL